MPRRQEPQVTMLAFVDLDARVPSDHPLCITKALADQALAAMRERRIIPHVAQNTTRRSSAIDGRTT